MKNSRLITTALLTAFVSATGVHAEAQSLLFDLDGDSFGDRLGWSVAEAGDVNRDGFDDAIAGAPRDDDNGTSAGKAIVISGANGSVLYTFLGVNTSDQLGRAVGAAGDVNMDGFDDVIAGAPFEDDFGTNSGAAFVYSGFDGSVLHDLNGLAAGDEFGSSMAGLGDIDGDGRDDFAIGAPQPNTQGAGYVKVYSGETGAVLFTLTGTVAQQQFGISVDGAGLVDADLVPDLIVGAWLDSTNGPTAGLVRVISGADGSTIHTLLGDDPSDYFGFSVAGTGDINGDGRGDLVVGAYGDDDAGDDAGRVTAFSGLDASVLFLADPDDSGDQFGWSVSGGGDLNGDGVGDVVVGAPFSADGYTRALSGIDGSTLWTLTGDASGDIFGRSVAILGDANADGLNDVVIGAPLDDDNGTSSGSARLYAGECGSTALVYCTAGTSAIGCEASISSTGTPSATAPSGFLLEASAVEGGKDGLFFFGISGRQANSWGSGSSFQCVVPPLMRAGLLNGSGTPGQCDGAFSQDMNQRWTSKPSQNPGAGTVVQLQLWYRDPQNTSNQTTSLSDALELTMCP